MTGGEEQRQDGSDTEHERRRHEARHARSLEPAPRICIVRLRRPSSRMAVGIRFYPPREELRGIVARIYAHDTGASTPEDSPWLIVPDGDVKLIFPFAGAIRCRIAATERLHAASRLIVSGMRTEPGVLSFPHGVSAIGVILRPQAAYRVLRVPQTAMVN